MNYLLLQLLIAVTFLLLIGIRTLLKHLNADCSETFWRSAHHTALIATVFVPLIISLVQPSAIFAAPVQVWAEIPKTQETAFQPDNFTLSFRTSKEAAAFEAPANVLSILTTCLYGLMLAGLLFQAVRFARGLRSLRAIRKDSVLFRKIGGVQVYFTDSTAIPFATSFCGTSQVFLPESLLAKPSLLKAALAHEFQHLRHHDVAWMYGLEILKSFLFLNPFVHAWIRKIEECHEFACDEALLGQQRISAVTYGRCLIQVAESALNLGQASTPSGSVGMSVSHIQLNRRIEMILIKRKVSKSWIGSVLVASALGLTTATAVAAKGSVADRRMTLAEAQELVEKTNKTSEIPTVVDENVLKYLNKGVGTERGRLYLKATLKRMKAFEGMVGKKLEAGNLPEELLAIPIVESGYQNVDNGIGAGLWAFIPGTARHFGLKVNDDIDQRFDPELETNAAVQYYKKLYGEFKDWHLALLAYNAGESSVRSVIEKTGIRDAFRLVREKHMKKEQEYLPMTMAAIIILKNPSLLD